MITFPSFANLLYCELINPYSGGKLHLNGHACLHITIEFLVISDNFMDNNHNFFSFPHLLWWTIALSW